MADYVEDIKSRVGIYDVVSQYVQLKKAGHNYKGLCPFHSEKTSSFVVSPEKQICHCFGCNKGGDIFTFVQEMEGVSFPEAIKILADKAGIEIKDGSSEWKKELKSEKDEYFTAHDLACEFFEHELIDTNDGAKVLDYLYKRGLTDETIKKFRIGFAPDKYDALHPVLLKKGVKRDVLIASGLVSTKNIGDNNIYDKYRSRLMFPIFDALGRICGFGGRALNKDQMPKYLNSPENIIYSKSKVLYGLNFAKDAIKEAGSVVFVEGYFDVVLPHQEGVCNVVATSGTALTDDQAKIVKRITTKATTCFDNDSAGFMATRRANDVLSSNDIFVSCVSLDHKDPADFVLAESGKALSEKFSKSVPFFTFLLDKLVTLSDISTFEGRKSLLFEITPLFTKMSVSDRDFCVRQLSKKINIDEKVLYDEINSFKLPVNHPAKSAFFADENKFKPDVEDQMLALLLAFPDYFSNFNEILSENDFGGYAKSIYKELCDQYNSSRVSLDKWVFGKSVEEDIKKRLNVLAMYAQDKYQNFADNGLLDEVRHLLVNLKLVRIKSELDVLQRKINESDSQDDINKLSKSMIELIKQKQRLI